MIERAVGTLWHDDGIAARAGRTVLTPLSWLYAAGATYLGERQARHASAPPIPVLSVGNVSVGGTGKTPVTAWTAARLQSLGAAPAIVMRGFGDDEPQVHATLNPEVPVIIDADRVRGVAAALRSGADCVVLDDAFQHRRIRRLADWVLVSAEQWRPDARVLPAGPLREPLGALRRADAVIITRKCADMARAERCASDLAGIVGAERVATIHLQLGALETLDGSARSDLLLLNGKRVLAVAAVGDPQAFFAQLRGRGLDVVEAPFADHHAFTRADAARLARMSRDCVAAVCTLKDAVKLASLWAPAATPLWYVSQQLVVERGGKLLDHWLEAVLAERPGASSTAGSAGTSNLRHGHRPSIAD